MAFDPNRQILKEFQLTGTSDEKSKEEVGLKMAQYIVSTVNAGIGGYYYSRNNRFRQNRNSANGRINMQKFQDLLELNGKLNYVNINWQSIRIVNRIISGLVGRWMERREKVSITATDALSVKSKVDEYENVEFVMDNRQILEKLQEESGVQMIPQDMFIPADKEELNLWVAQFQRLPEEIKYEMGCNDVLGSNGWFDILKRKMLHDSAEVGLVGSYTWMDENGVIHVEWVKPENIIYSFSLYEDFRDTTWRGQIKALKISELREKYGSQFGGKLTEEQLFKIAQTSKEYQLSDKITWNEQWVTNYNRPYDEWNVDIYDFEVRTIDKDYNTIVTTRKNKSTIVKRGAVSKPADNEKVEEEKKWNIYRGVYIRTTDFMLEWGIKKNMIRPQDPKEIGNAEFSYSFYMYQNYEMRNIAIPEKIEEPADQMILARLKIQQLVAKMRPTGAAINWDALQNIDYGLGDKNAEIDVKKLYDQTGDIYYRGQDASGKQIGVPIQELQNSGFLPQMQGLMDLYRFHYSVLRDELGEDPNLAENAVQPRVTQGNVQTSQNVAANATDYMYHAYAECMKDTAKKVSILLKDSVEYGASVYRKLVNQEDLTHRVFGTKIQFLPDEQDILKFEALLNNAITTNADLVLYIDPFQLMRVAKEDVKLAETLFRQGQKKMIKTQQDQALENQRLTFEGQKESAIASEKEKQNTKRVEGEVDINKAQIESESANKTAVITMVSSMLSKGVPVPPNMQPLVDVVVENMMIPLVVQNEEQKKQIMQQMQSENTQENVDMQPEQEQPVQEIPSEQPQLV